MKRLLFIALILFIAPVDLWATAYTSTQAGDFNSAATWGGGGYPIDGDTASVGHAVTVGSSAVVGASGATGTAAVTLMGAGSIAIQAPLQLRGDLIQQRGATITGTPGGSITFTPPSGSTYVWATNNTGSGTATINLSGTTGEKFPVTTTQGGGGNAWVSDSGAIRSGKWTLSNVIFTYFGSSTQPGFAQTNLYDFGGVQQNLTITNLVWDNCGQFYAKDGGTGATLNYIINGFDIRNPLGSTEVFRLINSIDKTGGTRSITGLTIYNNTGLIRSAYLGVRDSVLANIVSHNILWTGFMGIRSTASNNFFTAADVSIATALLSITGKNTQTLTDSVFFTNPPTHYIDEGSTAGSLNANTYQGNVFDGDGVIGADAGDILVVQSATGSNFIKNIAINNAGTLVTTMGNDLAGNVVITGNTSHDSYGVTVGETSGGASHVAKFQNNLIVNQADGLHQEGFFKPQAGLTLDHNGYYNIVNVSPHIWAADNYAYMASTGPPARIKITAKTTQVGTTTTHVVGTGSPWATVVAGDFVQCSGRGVARISTVTDANTLELDRAIVGMTAGDSVTITNAWFASGYYGDGTKGVGDVNANPGFVDATRTVKGYGSWASVEAAAREMVTINGTAYDGTATTPTTKTPAAINRWVKVGFTPTNPALKTAGYGGTYIGAMDVVSLGNPAALLMVQ